jgi:hypothetical protein
MISIPALQGVLFILKQDHARRMDNILVRRNSIDCLGRFEVLFHGRSKSTQAAKEPHTTSFEIRPADGSI